MSTSFIDVGTNRLSHRIHLWPIDKLVPYERNPRTHSAVQIKQIADSILQFGFVAPILVDDQAGIIAGHGRLEAAKSLAMEKVPVVKLTGLSEKLKRAYLIADNRLAENAGWDEDLLSEELKALESEDFQVGVLGFSENELEALLEFEASTDNERADQIAFAALQNADHQSAG